MRQDNKDNGNMKNYDFDTPVNRRGTFSYKWDVEDRELPMWVADMDFRTAPEIIQALTHRTEHGIFGYSIVPEQWYQAYQVWWKNRHGLELEKESLIFCTGAVPAISTAVRKLTTPGENVVVLTPVYNIFFNSIRNNGRNVLESPLRYDPDSHEYEIDFRDLEEKLSDPQTSMLIFCNPHNPVGKIWDIETLKQIGTLCRKYHVVVISDELHCDLTAPGKDYVPFASASDICRSISVTCLAPTKCFNLAGLQTAAVMIPDPYLRHKMWRALNTDEVAEPNAYAVDAVIAAYTQGAAWLDALREYIAENKRLVTEYIGSELPILHVIPSDATYLLWLDCREMLEVMNTIDSMSETGMEGYMDDEAPSSDDRKAAEEDPAPDTENRAAWDSGRLAEDIRRKTGLYLADGVQYGGNGASFLRMNVACPKAYVKEGLKRLTSYVSHLDLFL